MNPRNPNNDIEFSSALMYFGSAALGVGAGIYDSAFEYGPMLAFLPSSSYMPDLMFAMGATACGAVAMSAGTCMKAFSRSLTSDHLANSATAFSTSYALGGLFELAKGPPRALYNPADLRAMKNRIAIAGVAASVTQFASWNQLMPARFAGFFNRFRANPAPENNADNAPRLQH